MRLPGISIGIPAAALAVGLGMVLYPMLASGFVRTPGEVGDGRLVHFTLEHAYQSLGPDDAGRSLWDPPILYPAENVAAFTDIMVGQLPFYGPWRLLGASPGAAKQAWLVVALALNFAVFYRLLRDCLGADTVGATVGAFIFAFGSPSIAAVDHLQMLARVWVALALLALWKTLLTVRAGEHGWKEQIWVPVFFLALALQAWSAFYHLYFLLLFIALALPVALAMREGRSVLRALVRYRWPVILASGFSSLALVAPLIVHYGASMEEIGGRNWAPVARRLPRWYSWIQLGPGSFLYGWLQRPGGPLALGRFVSSGIHCNGVGLVTLSLAAAGLYQGRSRIAVRIILWVTLLVVVSTTMLPGGFSIWSWIYEIVPGASALRAIARIGLHLAIPIGVGLAVFFRRLSATERWGWILVLGLLVAAEQVRRVRSYDTDRMRERVAEIAEQVDSGCSAFYVSSLGKRPDPLLEEDAMWAALETGVPTINGRYGSHPRGYPRALRRPHRRWADGSSAKRTAVMLNRWMARRGRDLAGVCWIEVDMPRSAGSARRLDLPELR